VIVLKSGLDVGAGMAPALEDGRLSGEGVLHGSAVTARKTCESGPRLPPDNTKLPRFFASYSPTHA
jgi:hypothetical protein